MSPIQLQPSGRVPYHHGALRSALLDAAEAELADHGIEKFSLRGCARRAGVSHAAPAHHFGSVDGLLAELAAIGFRRLTATMTARMSSALQKPREQLIASGEGYVAFSIDNAALFRLMFSSQRPELKTDAARGAAADAFETLRSQVMTVIGDATARETEPTVAIAACWAMVHGLSHLFIEGSASFIRDLPPGDRDALLRKVIALSVSGSVGR